MNTLVLNSSNVVGINNSQFQYKFINGAFTINEGAEICISQITIPYSWFNINQNFYSNATLQYRWYYGTGLYNTFTVVFPSGFYTINDLNNYLQQFMISQNQYFYNSTTGLNQYYISIQTNTTYYSNQIILNPIPSSLPTNYTIPSTTVNGYTYSGFNCNTTTAGSTGSSTSFYPSVGYTYTPQIVISSFTGTASIGSIIGFTGGIYPSTLSSVSYNVLSNITPNATVVNSLICRCNIANNSCSFPSDIVDTFPINAQFGSQIEYIPSYEKYVFCSPGIYHSIIVTICDQNFNPIQANDPNVLISLTIKQPKNITNPTPLKPTTSLKSINFMKQNNLEEE